MAAPTPEPGLSERNLRAIEAQVDEAIRGDLLGADEWAIIRDHVPALAAEVRRLRAALEHYADEENWSQDPRYRGFNDFYDAPGNGYDVARAALVSPGQQVTEPPADRCVCGAHTRSGCGTWCSDYRRTQALAAPGAAAQ